MRTVCVASRTALVERPGNRRLDRQLASKFTTKLPPGVNVSSPRSRCAQIDSVIIDDIVVRVQNRTVVVDEISCGGRARRKRNRLELPGRGEDSSVTAKRAEHIARRRRLCRMAPRIPARV